MSIADFRKEYLSTYLSEEEAMGDPHLQFANWFEQALAAQVPEPTAMSLSTVGANGRPSSRIVLLKEFNPTGFVWFTNYQSRKGQELAQHSDAALLFHWSALERQVRIEGKVHQLTREENDRYFFRRPRASQIGAIISEQSQPIAARQMLDEKFEQLAKNSAADLQRPAHWGGYRLIPDYFEFWQGRASRLHDRLAYLKKNSAWIRQRLQP